MTYLGQTPNASNYLVQTGTSLTPRSLFSRFSNVINILDYGADPTGVSDSSTAYANALAAANTQADAAIGNGLPVTTASLYFPPGNYTINTGGTVFNCNLSFISDGKESVRLVLGSGVVLLTITGTIYQFNCDNVFTTSGGIGIIQQTATGSNDWGVVSIKNNAFYGYSGAAIGSLSSDFPYWRIEDNVFYGSFTSKGVVLAGDNTKSLIRSNAFLENLYHLKLNLLGDAIEISNNDFIRYANGNGSPYLTDVWLVPNGSATNAGNGIIFSNNKFGNENLNVGDYRVLVANQGTGSNFFTANHAASLSSGYAVGLIFRNNVIQGVSGMNNGIIYSYTPNLRSWDIQDCYSDNSVFPYIFQYDSSVSITTDDFTIPTNLLWVNTPIDTVGAAYLTPSNWPSTVVVASDPLGFAQGFNSQRQQFNSGSDPSYTSLISTTNIRSWSTSNVSTSNINDSRGGTNAVTATYSAAGVNGQFATGVTLGSIQVGSLAWLEFDVRQSSSFAATKLEVYINLNSGSGPVFKRFVNIPSVWSTIRLPWVPNENSNGISYIFSLGDYSAGTKTNVDLGIPRLYHAKEPINFAANYLQNSISYSPASLAPNGSITSTTVTVMGANLGDFVVSSFSLDLQSLLMWSYVSSANTVTVVLQNNTGSTVSLSSGTLSVKILRNL